MSVFGEDEAGKAALRAAIKQTWEKLRGLRVAVVEATQERKNNPNLEDTG